MWHNSSYLYEFNSEECQLKSLHYVLKCLIKCIIFSFHLLPTHMWICLTALEHDDKPDMRRSNTQLAHTVSKANIYLYVGHIVKIYSITMHIVNLLYISNVHMLSSIRWTYIIYNVIHLVMYNLFLCIIVVCLQQKHFLKKYIF